MGFERFLLEMYQRSLLCIDSMLIEASGNINYVVALIRRPGSIVLLVDID